MGDPEIMPDEKSRSGKSAHTSSNAVSGQLLFGGDTSRISASDPTCYEGYNPRPGWQRLICPPGLVTRFDLVAERPTIRPKPPFPVNKDACSSQNKYFRNVFFGTQ
jgi:hypothetical protein